MLKFFKKKTPSSSPEPNGKSSGSVNGLKSSGETSWTPLETLKEAVESNNLNQIKKLASANPSLCSAPLDALGQTCLHLAATIGNIDCVEVLLKHGDPNVNDSIGNTAFHVSVAHPEVVKLFLRKKTVDVNRLALQRNSILHIMAKRLTPIDDDMWSMLKKVRTSLENAICPRARAVRMSPSDACPRFYALPSAAAFSFIPKYLLLIHWQTLFVTSPYGLRLIQRR